MFYLLDDAFRVGEYIESGSYKGTVESFSLRSVKLRHHRGSLFTVPFGELGAVQNMSRDWVIDKFNVTVGYNTDIEKARKMIKRSASTRRRSRVRALGYRAAQDAGGAELRRLRHRLRMKMTTKPGEQFPIRRKAWVRLKQLFEQNGIEIPFPTVMVREGESAAAAAAHLQAQRDKDAAAKAAAAGS